MRLIINIDSDKNGEELAKFLRSVEYVKSVEVEDNMPLAGEDWVKPGRPATEAEMEALADAMDKDADEGISTEQLQDEMRQWIAEVTR